MSKTITSFIAGTLFSMACLANGLTNSYPPPYEAYTAIANQSDDGWTIQVNVQEGFYLYKKDFEPQLDTGSQLVLLDWSQPTLFQVEDPLRGQVDVMRDQFTTQIQPNAKGELWLGLQGCADSGFCYPPEKRLLAIISE